MERRKHEEGKSSKSSTVVKAIVGLAGSLAVSAVASWVMPKIQKKMADKIYKKMM